MSLVKRSFFKAGELIVLNDMILNWDFIRKVFF